MEALEARTPGPNPKFIQFAQKLVERYPSRPGDPDANDAVWMGNPVDDARNGSEAVFGISLPSHGRSRIMRFVVQAANELGLTVLDEQLGIAFLPGGKVLPEDARDVWKELDEETEQAAPAWTKAQARKALVTYMTAALGKHGFVPEKVTGIDAAFVRQLEPGGRQSIRFALQAADGELECTIHFVTTYDVVKGLHERFCGKYWVLGGTEDSLFLTLDDLYEAATFRLAGSADLESLGALFEAKAIPVLDRARTFKGLDALINVEGRFPRRAKFRVASLIVARLAGNPNFEAMAEEYRLNFEKHHTEDTKQKVRQLTAYLKESVRPA